MDCPVDKNMRNSIKTFIVILMVVLFYTDNNSLAVAKFLKTEEAKYDDVTGTYNLILYGGRHINDLETAAFLDREGDQYEFEPYAPEFDYKIKRGVPAEEALKEAKKFVSFHNAFWRSQLSRILDEKGNVIGYELRPLYRSFVYGRDDLLEIYYRIKGDKVIIEINLTPDIFKIPFLGDVPNDLGGF
jgi:hypothetical protein